MPEGIDLALIATPAKTVPEIVRDCVVAGVKGAIIISAGFKEIGAVAIGVMSWASVRLTFAFEGLGAGLRFSEGLLGIVTALGADAPETCSSFAALISPGLVRQNP